MSEEIMVNEGTETSESTQETVEQKTYTQEEFDRHMAGLKNSLAKKFEKQYADLGDPEELRKLKSEAEKRKVEEQINRGEFEKTLQELAQKKDEEIQKRDQVIREYRVNTPLLNAAAQHGSVNPEQVRTLLSNRVRLDDSGETQVLDDAGNVRYTDSGEPLGVDQLVREFLDSNPHFRVAQPATTNTRSSVSADRVDQFDVSRLDMTNPQHRKMYKEAKSKGLV